MRFIFKNNKTHLKDVLDNIGLIVVVDDIENYHINTDFCLDEDWQDDLSNATDDTLRKLSTVEIDKITDINLLDRLYKLIPQKFSIKQKQVLKDYYKKYSLVIDKSDVQVFLDKIKKCNRLILAGRPKNTSFLYKYDLYNDDCLNILHQLKVSDYVENRKSFNDSYFGNDLMVFEPSTIVLNGNIFSNLIIYVKIDTSKTSGTDIVAVSLHETNKRDNRAYNS